MDQRWVAVVVVQVSFVEESREQGPLIGVEALVLQKSMQNNLARLYSVY